jgi:OmcA/MtrC family decaheme c-type cytochrome
MSERAGFLGTFIRVGACMLLAGALLAACSNGKDGAPGAAGTTGAVGPPGPVGPTGPVLALDISTAQTLTAKITSVTGGDSPTIKFSLADENGQPLKGLQASTVRFAIAQLQPPVAGSGTSSQWRSYVTRIDTAVTGVGWGTTPQVQATAEAASTSGAVLKDNGDGTYTYTFSKSLTAFAADSTTKGVALAYDGTLTHRIGMEFRGTTATPTNNAVYTYVPATGATTGYYTRDIVNNAVCNACHDKLAFHGGPRTDVQYCVICHNSGTTDAQSGNTVDMKVMVHKIHRGISLPTVVAAGNTTPAQGKGYTIWGNGNSLNNFNTIIFPQDQRNCTTCHKDATDPTTPDAFNYKNVPYSGACGTCHDNVNFATGAGHGPAPGIIATDKDCATCHGPSSGLLSNGLPMTVVGAHTIPELAATANYRFQVVKIEPVTDAAGTIPDSAACPPAGPVCLIPQGDYAKVTIKVTNPATGAAYKLTDPGFSPTSFVPNPTNPAAASAAPSVTVDLAMTTANFTNPTNPQNSNANRSPPITIRFLSYGSAVASGALTYAAATATATSGAPPPQNADGSYTRVAPVPVTCAPPVSATCPTPATLIGINGNVSGAAFIEGRAVINVAPAGQTASFAAIGISAADPFYFPIALPAGVTQAAARRTTTDINRCNDCHRQLQFHSDARNNSSRLCTVCHNPEMTAGSYPAAAGQAVAGPMDFKFFIHGIHSANYNYGSHNFTASAPLPTPYPILAEFSSVPVGFPGAINNCEDCHTKGADSYYPVDDAKVFATTVWGGTAKGPQDDLAITPNVAACGACHTTTLAQEHMQQNGGVIVDPIYNGNYAAQVAAMGGSIKNADGSTKPQYQTETCTVCHGPGATADVKVVHSVASYQ